MLSISDLRSTPIVDFGSSNSKSSHYPVGSNLHLAPDLDGFGICDGDVPPQENVWFYRQYSKDSTVVSRVNDNSTK